MILFQIPDEAYNQLQRLLDDEGENKWAIGDFIKAYWEEMLKYVNADEVRDAHAKLIRDFADNTGADRTTLRDREKMSLFFSVADRERYSVFSYHQFRALRSAGEEMWEQWAEWALENSFNGRPASLRRIRDAMDADRDPRLFYQKKLARMEADAYKVLADEHAPQEVKDGVQLIITILLDTREHYE